MTIDHNVTAPLSNLKVQIRIENWQNKVNTLEDLANLVWGF
jgi:hypothetical protein